MYKNLLVTNFNNTFSIYNQRNRNLKQQEDSGVSSRKGDDNSSCHLNLNSESTASSIEKNTENLSQSKEEYSCSDYSRRFNVTRLVLSPGKNN